MKRMLRWLTCIGLVAAMLATPIVSYADSTPQAAPLVTQSASKNGMIRVWLASIGGKTSYTITVSGSYALAGMALADGSVVTIDFTGGRIYATVNGARTDIGTSATFQRSSGGLKIAQSLSPSNIYPGDLSLSYSGGTAFLICTLYIEDYIYGVLPYEMDEAFPLEALKAQAIAARTYAIKAKKTSGTYDVTDMINHQVFRGVNYSNTNCIKAVDATRGIVITYNGAYIDANYSASNGGQTELNSNAWNASTVGYSQMRADPYDLANPYSRKATNVIYKSGQQGANTNAYALIRTALASAKGGSASDYVISQVTSVTPHTPKYGVDSLVFTKLRVAVVYGNGQQATVDLNIFPDVKNGLGLALNTASNELISVTEETDAFRITSRRYGHGVGMSQRGAQQMANQGYAYAQILGFYYKGVQLSQESFSANWSNGTSTTPTTVPSLTTTGSTGKVTLQNVNSRLNMRNSPNTTGAIIARLSHGTQVTIQSESGGWYQVLYGSLTGYVSSAYITLEQGSTSGAATSGIGTAYILADSGMLSVRTEARATAEVAGTIPSGTLVTVTASDASWSQITYGTLTGYVPTQNLSFTTAVTSGDTEVAIVTLINPKDNLNLRQNPSTSSPILTRLPHGTALLVLEKQSTWTKVSTQGMTGYVMNDYITFKGVSQSTATTTTNPTSTGQSWRAFVNLTAGTLNLRVQPGTSAYIVTQIPNQAEVAVTQVGEEWCAIVYGKHSGYVMRKFLTIDGNPVATSIIGTPAPSATTSPSMLAVARINATNGTSATIYEDKSTATTQLLVIAQGTEVYVLSRADDWSQVQAGVITGYIETANLSFTGSSVTIGTQTVSGSTAYVATQSGGPVNLRATAPYGQVLQLVAHGTQVTVVSTSNGWSQVQVGGKTGYISAQYLTGTAPASAASSGTLLTQSPILDENANLTTVLNTAKLTVPVGHATTVILRATADDQGETLTTIVDGTQVDILKYAGTNAEWMYVRAGTLRGFARRELFTLQQRVATISLTQSDSLNVYAQPSDTSTVGGTLRHGDIVTVITEYDASWVQIRMASGVTGYIPLGSILYQ